MKIDPYLSPCTKLMSKCIKDLNINLTTRNLIEEKLESILQCMDTRDIFQCKTPVAQRIRAIMNKWDLLKLRSFCKAKITVIKTKWQPTDWEKIFTNLSDDKGLIPKIYK